MRILALDLGDVWVGSALSDPSQSIASPLQTVTVAQLPGFLQTCIDNYQISTVVVGLPTTLRGTQSEQTKKTIATKEALERQFPLLQWVLWDERLTSKQADQLKKAPSAHERQRSHSRAAAFILQAYLERLHFLKQ